MNIFKRDNSEQIKSLIIKDVIFIVLLVGALGIPTLFNFFKYRPWIVKPFSLILLSIHSFLMVFYPLYIFKKRSFKLFPQKIGFKVIWKEFYIALLTLIPVAILIGTITNILSSVLKTKIVFSSFVKMMNFAPSNLYLIIIAIWGFTIAPIAEEILFRGMIYNTLKSKMAVIFAVILTSLLYAILHGIGLIEKIYIFAISIFYIFMYEKRKNILQPIFLNYLSSGVLIIYLLIPIIINFHNPANNLSEAKQSPKWIQSVSIIDFVKQDSGIKQHAWIVNKWGSKGSKKWKKELVAFQKLQTIFPEDIEARSGALVAIADIYYKYLHDNYRVIVNCDIVLTKYKNQKYSCANALAKKGWALYLLKEFKESKEAFNGVLKKYSDYHYPVKQAEMGLEWLEKIKQ